MCHARERHAVPQSLGRSLAWLCSGLGSQLIADQESQQHLLRDRKTISAEKQPQNIMYPNSGQQVSDFCSDRY